MANENPKYIEQELADKLAQTWGTHAGPQKVKGKTIQQDPYLADYFFISQVLGNAGGTDMVVDALSVFNRHLFQQVPNVYRYARSNPWISDQDLINEVATYLKGRNKNRLADTRNPQLKKLFSTALLEGESKAGFDRFGEPVTLSGGIDGEIFQRDLVGGGRRWKDVGVPGNHGERTHRLQWYIIAYQLRFRPGLTDLYRHIGQWVWARDGVPKYLALWDALFDRHPTDNPFPPHNEMDFRSPENLCNWIIKPENEPRFPLLHAYLKARFEKRRDPSFNIKDYLAIKLYGRDIASLQAEFERTGDMSKLLKVAAETDSPVELGDGERALAALGRVPKPTPGTKIHERASYHGRG